MVVNEGGFTYFVCAFQQARFVASLCFLSEFARYRRGNRLPGRIFVRFCTEVRFRVVWGGSAEKAGKIAYLLLIVTYADFFVNEASRGLLRLLFLIKCHVVV